MLYFPTHLFSWRRVPSSSYGNLVFVRSVDFTSRLGVGENIQSQDLRISSFLDHLLQCHRSGLMVKIFSLFSTVHDLTVALLLT